MTNCTWLLVKHRLLVGLLAWFGLSPFYTPSWRPLLRLMFWNERACCSTSVLAAEVATESNSRLGRKAKQTRLDSHKVWGCCATCHSAIMTKMSIHCREKYHTIFKRVSLGSVSNSWADVCLIADCLSVFQSSSSSYSSPLLMKCIKMQHRVRSLFKCCSKDKSTIYGGQNKRAKTCKQTCDCMPWYSLLPIATLLSHCGEPPPPLNGS